MEGRPVGPAWSHELAEATAVARVLQLYPELHDWPPEELEKIAPSIIEQHAERERADES